GPWRGALCFLTATFLGIVPLASRASSGPEALEILDPATGEIDGISALAIYPVRFEGSRAVEVLDLEDCEVHLVPVEDRSVERVHPCAAWFLEDAGRYEYWIEAGDLISPFARMVIYNRRPFVERGLPGATAVGPAGRVLVATDIDLASGGPFELRLVHAGDYLLGGMLQRELSRRTPLRNVGSGVLMPAGPTLAALWDRRRNRYVALSRLFRVSPSKVVETPLRSPKDRSYLLAQILRRELTVRIEEAALEIGLASGGRVISPDAVVHSSTRILAVWYDLPPGPAELRAMGPRDTLEPVSLDLDEGAIERVVAQLEPLPSLDVELDLPSSLRNSELFLGVRRPGAEEWWEYRALAEDAWTEAFPSVPRGVLEVVLVSPWGQFRSEVDLRAAEEGFLRLAPELIEVKGTVYSGEDTHAAELAFASTRKGSISVATDEEGDFEVLSLEPLRSVSIHLEGVDAAPYVEYFIPEPIRASAQRDFRVPDQVIRTRVIDSTTGQGISGARIVARNRFLPEDGSYEQSVVQQVETDSEGLARLPPARPGDLELRATAPGYLRPTEPRVVEIGAELGLGEQEIEILLEPLGPASVIRIRLPAGHPAAGAHVALVEPGTGRILEQAEADEEGALGLPDRLSGALALVRHPSAGFAVQPWQPEGFGPEEWTLPPRGPDLIVQAVDSRGGAARGRYSVSLLVAGRRLEGHALFWLMGSRPITDAHGSWTASNLPLQSFSILVSERASASGGPLHEALFTPVDPPWQPQVEVPVATR
ncbi:MAG: carboxypeptidase-like regulatory domain-containing protein, partial [Holophagales bacterium]|nr:carboxypeptidase-like regulatory domain-containing protein [Holophagales bacterium]